MSLTIGKGADKKQLFAGCPPIALPFAKPESNSSSSSSSSLYRWWRGKGRWVSSIETKEWWIDDGNYKEEGVTNCPLMSEAPNNGSVRHNDDGDDDLDSVDDNDVHFWVGITKQRSSDDDGDEGLEENEFENSDLDPDEDDNN